MHYLKNILLLAVAFGAGWLANDWLTPLLQETDRPLVTVEQRAQQHARVIFTNNDVDERAPITINRVMLIQQSSRSLILDIEYVYQHAVPAEQVKLFVSAKEHALIIGESEVHTGQSRARVSLRIDEERFKAQASAAITSEQLSISFEHYPPGQYRGSLFGYILPFIQRWSLT